MLQTMKMATLAGMAQVRKDQLRCDSEVEFKSDLSPVTPTDEASQDAILEVLSGLRDINFACEEKGERIGALRCRPPSRIKMFVDPMDGTGAFQIGIASSTIIVAAYDSASKRLIACTIGDPALGRMWSASDDQPTMLDWYDTSHWQLLRSEQRHVWKGSLDRRSTVLLDVSHGFREASSNQELLHLFRSLQGTAKVQIPGSNGLIQALVANGREGIAGSVTTAISGPWDLCGTYLVHRAGGFIRAFNFREGIIEEKDPLDVTAYHTVVTGNTKRTVDMLADMRISAYRDTNA